MWMDLWSYTESLPHQNLWNPWNPWNYQNKHSSQTCHFRLKMLNSAALRIFLYAEMVKHTLKKIGGGSFPSVVKCPGLLRISSHHFFNNSVQRRTVIPKPLLPCWHRRTASCSNVILLHPPRERMQKSQAEWLSTQPKRKTGWLVMKLRQQFTAY